MEEVVTEPVDDLYHPVLNARSGLDKVTENLMGMRLNEQLTFDTADGTTHTLENPGVLLTTIEVVFGDEIERLVGIITYPSPSPIIPC